MIHKTTATLELAGGSQLQLEYHWMILNDCGDFQLIVWEPLPEDSPSDSVPDLILNCATGGAREAEYDVRRKIQSALMDLARGYTTVRSWT